ncbi:MAG: EcsC family protein [Lachnospiraceae bacterium]|nr:EcsC family protein [Lachnospiraceae bacterium]
MFTRKSPFENELQKLQKQETAFLNKHSEESDSRINQLIKEKIPEKLQNTLDNAFAKSFSTVFQKGTGIIEKTYKKDEMEKNFDVNMYAAKRKNTKKEWKTFSRQSVGTGNKNLVISGAAGIGLGILGIGIPDIVFFVGLQLRSIYEMALQYGYTYEEEQERRFILLLFQGALSHGKEQREIDDQINRFIDYGTFPDSKELEQCIAEASACLSKELLYMKFLQGIPLVGAVGGAFDAIYMRRINQYAELKYRRRFLYKSKSENISL